MLGIDVRALDEEFALTESKERSEESGFSRGRKEKADSHLRRNEGVELRKQQESNEEDTGDGDDGSSHRRLSQILGNLAVDVESGSQRGREAWEEEERKATSTGYTFAQASLLAPVVKGCFLTVSRQMPFAG